MNFVVFATLLRAAQVLAAVFQAVPAEAAVPAAVAAAPTSQAILDKALRKVPTLVGVSEITTHSSEEPKVEYANFVDD